MSTPYEPKYKVSFFPSELAAQKISGLVISDALQNFPVTREGHVISW
jgi:hypothetical protein